MNHREFSDKLYRLYVEARSSGKSPVELWYNARILDEDDLKCADNLYKLSQVPRDALLN